MICYIKDEVYFLKKKKELCYFSVWEKLLKRVKI